MTAVDVLALIVLSAGVLTFAVIGMLILTMVVLALTAGDDAQSTNLLHEAKKRATLTDDKQKEEPHAN